MIRRCVICDVWFDSSLRNRASNALTCCEKHGKQHATNLRKQWLAENPGYKRKKDREYHRRDRAILKAAKELGLT